MKKIINHIRPLILFIVTFTICQASQDKKFALLEVYGYHQTLWYCFVETEISYELLEEKLKNEIGKEAAFSITLYGILKENDSLIFKYDAFGYGDYSVDLEKLHKSTCFTREELRVVLEKIKAGKEGELPSPYDKLNTGNREEGCVKWLKENLNTKAVVFKKSDNSDNQVEAFTIGEYLKQQKKQDSPEPSPVFEANDSSDDDNTITDRDNTTTDREAPFQSNTSNNNSGVWGKGKYAIGLVVISAAFTLTFAIFSQKSKNRTQKKVRDTSK